MKGSTERRVLNVALPKCSDFIKMTAVLTLAWGDEKTAPYPSQNNGVGFGKKH